jgi:hypothetical protein
LLIFHQWPSICRIHYVVPEYAYDADGGGTPNAKAAAVYRFGGPQVTESRTPPLAAMSGLADAIARVREKKPCSL